MTEKEWLLDFLGQYGRAIREKRMLEKRLKNIQIEMEHPISGIAYSAVSYHTNDISSGSAALALRENEIEHLISEQIQEAMARLLMVMDVLDYLESGSNERIVLEHKYIDLCSWNRMPYDLHMSRSKCYTARNDGLEKLLTYKRVQKIVRNYASQKQAPPVSARKKGPVI